MADDFKHALDLVLSTFIDRHFEPGVFRSLPHLFDHGRGRHPILQLDATCELADFLIIEHALYFRQIYLRHMIARMQERLCQFPVIRQQHEPFRVEIEPPHRE